MVEFGVLFEIMYKKPILEPNKHPDAGSFATAPAEYDTFFTQDSAKQIVTRVAVNLKLRPNAMGFLRIGTQNTIYESLFGVIAPLIYKNSIEEVKERILEVMTPRVFINSHFGNLVLEFYNPMDGRAMPATRQELMSWSQRHLGIQLNSVNAYALLRIYNSYKRFVQFINDPTQRKDLRHIQPLLAEPGLFTPRGIQLIILEEDENHSYIIDDSSLNDRLSKFIDLYTEHCSQNLTKIFPKEYDAKIADAILELFRKRENLDIFNKKALYIYIREIVDVKTPKITKIANQLYDIFKQHYFFYLEHGYTNF